MRTLSLWQPWASLVASGAKVIETRSWRTDHTGPIAIHATLTFPAAARALCEQDVFYRTLFGTTLAEDLTRAWHQYGGGVGRSPRWRIDSLPRGAVVATARLAGCEPTDSPITEALLRERGEDEVLFGDYSPGRWAWVLLDVEALAAPVPAKGARGLWEWSP